jgi:hypothetical protein
MLLFLDCLYNKNNFTNDLLVLPNGPPLSSANVLTKIQSYSMLMFHLLSRDHISLSSIYSLLPKSQHTPTKRCCPCVSSSARSLRIHGSATTSRPRRSHGFLSSHISPTSPPNLHGNSRPALPLASAPTTTHAGPSRESKEATHRQ